MRRDEPGLSFPQLASLGETRSRINRGGTIGRVRDCWRNVAGDSQRFRDVEQLQLRSSEISRRCGLLGCGTLTAFKLFPDGMAMGRGDRDETSFLDLNRRRALASSQPSFQRSASASEGDRNRLDRCSGLTPAFTSDAAPPPSCKRGLAMHASLERPQH
jgi:hypothetical protein